MELIYLYVGRIGRPVEHFGVGFSRRFRVKFNEESGQLSIVDNGDAFSSSNIYGNNIKDIDLIVGKNGSGKSTILSLLGLSRTERLREYPVHINTKFQTDENNKRTWFALYYIERDYFAIEGNWCDTLEFMRDDSYIHFQTLYSLFFRYDYEKKTGYNVWHLQDLNLGKKVNFHRKLFFLYYENPIILDWVTSDGRVNRHDLGSSSMFERIMCERTGYRGITEYLFEANNIDEFFGFMGTKPGTVIKITVNTSGSVSETDRRSITSACDLVHLNAIGQYEIDIKKAAEYVYNDEISFIESRPLEIQSFLQNDRIINNGLTFKEAFVIAYLEQIAVHCVMHREVERKKGDAEALCFSIQRKGVNQTQYEWQKSHLIHIINGLLGSDSLDYKLVMGIVMGLERVPDECFVNYTEMNVFPCDMNENFLDYLMMNLDYNQQNADEHEINHRYYLKTEFNGISSGEARMIDIFAMLYNSLGCCCHEKGDTCVLLLDEPDRGFHPEWSRIFIEQLTSFLKLEVMRDYNYHIIISTHSPIMLSDVPKNCIHCITKEGGKVTVKESDNYGLISGINDVLIDAFFTGSVFGSFGEKYVNKIIEQITRLENKLNSANLEPDVLKRYSKECDQITDRIINLGDGYIKNSLHKRINRLRNNIKE